MKQKIRNILGALAAIALALLFTMGALSQRQPKTLGASAGMLADCPSRPNCVSSQATSDLHRVAPLAYADPPALAWDRLRSAVASMPRSKIITDDGTYLHVEFHSRVFRFVDDVEFLLDGPANKIDVRSASRIGYSDMGANRKRVEAIRIRFADMTSAPVVE